MIWSPKNLQKLIANEKQQQIIGTRLKQRNFQAHLTFQRFPENAQLGLKEAI